MSFKRYPTFLWNTNPGTADARIITPTEALRKHGGLSRMEDDNPKNKSTILCNPIDASVPEGISPWEKDIQIPDSPEFKARETEMIELFIRTNILIMENIHTQAGCNFLDWIKDKFDFPVVLTVDDYFVGIDPSHVVYPMYASGEKIPMCMGYALAKADAIITSTDYLSELYEKAVPKWASDLGEKTNKKLYTLGNYVDPKTWDLKMTKVVKRKKLGTVRMLFEGGHSHNDNMKLIEEPLTKLLKDHKDKLELITVGGIKPSQFKWGKLPNVHKLDVVNIDEFPQLMTNVRADINLAPMLDTVYMRAKSNLRFQVGSMLKIPTVASDVLPYQECREYGVSCPEPSDWYEAIKDLIENPDKRKAIGKKAHNYVKRKYSPKNCARDYENVIKDIRAEYYYGWIGKLIRRFI